MTISTILNWTSVKHELGGGKFVQHWRANLVERSLWLSAIEWQTYSPALKNEVVMGEMKFGDLTHTPQSGETFYAPIDSVMYQMEARDG